MSLKPLGSWFNSVIDITESLLSGVIDSAELTLNCLTDTSESENVKIQKSLVVIVTAESLLTLLIWLFEFQKALILTS